MNPFCILGMLWALPWTLFGLLLGVVALLTGGKAQRVGRVLEFHSGVLTPALSKMPFVKAAAMTWGHVILGRNQDCLDRCRAHEMIHVGQYEWWGPFFIPAYALASGWAWLRGRNPYLDNPFEVQAYRRAP